VKYAAVSVMVFTGRGRRKEMVVCACANRTTIHISLPSLPCGSLYMCLPQRFATDDAQNLF